MTILTASDLSKFTNTARNRAFMYSKQEQIFIYQIITVVSFMFFCMNSENNRTFFREAEMSKMKTVLYIVVLLQSHRTVIFFIAINAFSSTPNSIAI